MASKQSTLPRSPGAEDPGQVNDAEPQRLAETSNDYDKAEPIYGSARTGLGKAVEDVELTTRSLPPLDTAPGWSQIFLG